MGMMPARLIRPSVGLMPTRPLAEAGQTTEPSVSEPTATAQRLAAVAAPGPELEPQGLRSRAYGFVVWPPRPLHPLLEWLERMFAHSLRLVLPRITAPDSRSFCATKESRVGFDPSRASEPAVVCMRSAVSMLSLIRTGIPCMGPRTWLALRCWSSESAIARASGLISITLLMAGPCLSISSMRARYFSVMERVVNFPEAIPACRSAMVISSNSNGLTSAADGGQTASRAAANAGNTVAPTLASALVCKKRRRWGDPQSMTAFLRLKEISPVSQCSYERKRNYRPRGKRTCQLREDSIRVRGSCSGMVVQIFTATKWSRDAKGCA